jgi:hypothetical protein
MTPSEEATTLPGPSKYCLVEDIQDGTNHLLVSETERTEAEWGEFLSACEQRWCAIIRWINGFETDSYARPSDRERDAMEMGYLEFIALRGRVFGIEFPLVCRGQIDTGER